MTKAGSSFDGYAQQHPNGSPPVDPPSGGGQPRSAWDATLELGRILSSTLNLQEVADPFFSLLRQLIKCQMVTIYGVNQASDSVSVMLHASAIPMEWRPDYTWPLSGGQVEHHLINIGRPHYESAEASAFPGNRKYLKAGIRSVLWVPLEDKSQVIGGLAIRSVEPDAYAPGDLELAQQAAARITLAVSSANLFHQTRRQQQFAESLHRVSKSISASPDPATLLKRIGQECHGLIGMSHAAIWEVEGDALALRLAWPADSCSVAGVRRPLHGPGPSLVARAVNEGRTLVVNNIPNAPSGLVDKELARQSGAVALLAVPLLEGNRPIGALALTHAARGRQFTREDASMAEALATQAALALRDARLREELRQSASELALADEVARILTDSPNIGAVYERFAQALQKLVSFDRIGIVLLDEAAGAVRFPYLYGELQPGRKVGDVKPLAGSITEHLLQTRETLIARDISQERQFAGDPEILAMGMRSRMAAPIIAQGRYLGTLTLRSKRVGAFGERERAILERVTRQITPAIETDQFYQQLQASAATRQTIERVAQRLADAVRLNDALPPFLEDLRALMPFDQAFVGLVDLAAGTNVPLLHVGDIHLHQARSSAVNPLVGSETEQALALGKPLLRDDISADSRYPRDADIIRSGLRSSLRVAWPRRGNLRLTLVFYRREAGAFGPREEALLEALASPLLPPLEALLQREQLRDNAIELAAIDRVARVLTSSLNLDEVYPTFAEEVKKLVDYDRITINLINPETGTYTFRYVAGLVQPDRHAGDVEPLAGSLAEQVYLTGRVFNRPDINAEGRLGGDSVMAQLGLVSNIMVPLQVKSQVIGVMSLRSRQAGAFDARAQVILERLASQIAPAIENARLYQELQTHTEEMKLVDGVARLLTNALDIAQVYPQFAEQLRGLVEFDRISLSRLDDETVELFSAYSAGLRFRGEPGLGARLPAAGTFTKRVYETRQVMIRPDIAQNPDFDRDDARAQCGLRSALHVPLITQNRVVGVFNLFSRQPGRYGPRERRILERLASQVAPAVEKAELYAQLKAQAEEIELVEQVARILNATLEIDQVYPQFAQALQKLVPFHRTALTEIDAASATMTLKYLYAESAGGYQQGEPMPLANSVSNRILETGETQIISDISTIPSFEDTERYLRIGLRTVIGAPLLLKGRMIGTLVLRHPTPGIYGPRERRILERLASQIAPAIENARLYWQQQEQAQEKAAVDEVARIVTTTLNIDEVYQQFVQAVGQVVAFDRMEIILADLERGESSFRFLHGVTQPGRALGDRKPLAGTMTEHLMRTQQTLYRPNVTAGSMPQFPQTGAVSAAGLPCALSTPLIAHGKFIGSLTVRSRQPDAFDARSRRIMEGLAQQIAPAIANAGLFETVQEEKNRANAVLAQLKAVLEGVDAGILLLNDQKEVLWINETFCDYFNIPSASAVMREGRPGSMEQMRAIDRVSFADPDAFFGLRDKIDQDREFAGVLEEVEVVYPRRRVFTEYTAPVRDVAGRYLGRLWAYHDITLMREQEAAVRESEQKFRTLFELASDAIMTVALGGKIIEANQSASRLLGYSLEELRQLGGPQVLAPEIYEQSKLEWQRQLTEHGRFVIETLWVRKDGSRVPMSVSGTLLELGGQLALHLIGRDITEQKRAAEALQESERRFRALIENSSDMILLADARRVIRYVGPSARRVLGHDPEAMIGKSIASFIHPEDEEKAAQTFAKVLANPGEIVECELRWQAPDGSYRWLEGKGRNLLDDPAVAAVAANLRDVTERKRWQEQLAQLQKMESVGRLAGGVAHDFNNLLAGILGFASLLQNNLDPDSESYEFAKIIEQAAQRGAQLTQQLLTAGRKGPFAPRPLNVADVIQEVAQLVSRTFSKDVALETSARPNLPLALGDSGQLHQALLNLCINAADAMPQGGRLTLTAQAVHLDEEFCRQQVTDLKPGAYLRLDVSDTGSGIKPADLPHIFEPFFTTKGVGKGTGLGLSVVYGVVQNHKGHITVSSQPAQGTTFTIYLPVYATLAPERE